MSRSPDLSGTRGDGGEALGEGSLPAQKRNGKQSKVLSQMQERDVGTP
ncbi:hypothetical protein [Mesorhizobium sp. M4A.F.Ca.ET.050.02.1.1]|nr:hypothetical protein [Mesorhizobium sp. M4A.F.Ca.ET.050.02.1.1]